MDISGLCGSKDGWDFWKFIYLQFLWARTFPLLSFGTVPVHMLSVCGAISRYCPFENITLRSLPKTHHTFVPSFQEAAANTLVFNTEIQKVAALRGGGRLFYTVSTDIPSCSSPYEIHVCVYSLLLRTRVWTLAGGFCVRNGFEGNFVFTNGQRSKVMVL